MSETKELDEYGYTPENQGFVADVNEWVAAADEALASFGIHGYESDGPDPSQMLGGIQGGVADAIYDGGLKDVTTNVTLSEITNYIRRMVRAEALIKEMSDYLNHGNNTSIGSGSIFHQQMRGQPKGQAVKKMESPY